MPQHQNTPILRTIYGLTVASDIDLPELSAAQPGASPDIVIRQGAVAPVWQETRTDNLRAFIDGAPQHLWLNFPDTVRMEIRDGCELTYSIHPGGSEDAARLFLLGSGLATILMQRGFVVVHGNVITLPEASDAIVCIGDSGAGKSTTAIAMMQRGYSILADDICPIGPTLQIEPGMPRAKLWDETARLMQIDTSGLRPVRDGDAKFNLPLGDRHCRNPRAIGLFVWLVPGDVSKIECSEVTGVDKFAVLRNNIYRPEYLVPLQLEADYLKQVAQIAGQTRVFSITRPVRGFDIDPLLDMIALLYERNAAEPAQP